MTAIFLERCEKSQNGHIAPDWQHFPYPIEDIYPDENSDDRGILVDVPDSWVTDAGKAEGVSTIKKLRSQSEKEIWDRAVHDAIVALHCFLANFDEGDDLYMPVSAPKSRGSSLQVPHGSWY